MSSDIFGWHYAILALLVASGLLALFRARGVSLLAIYSLSMAAQIGMALPWCAEGRAGALSNQAIERFGQAQLLSYGILICALLSLARVLRKSMPVPASSQLELGNGWRWAGGGCLIMLLALRYTSTGGQFVMTEGLGAIASGNYYEMRGQLIDVEMGSDSRIIMYSEMVLRRVLTFLVIAIGYEVVRKKDLGTFLTFLILFIGLLACEASRYQKAPTLWAFAAGASPFIFAARYRLNGIRFAGMIVTGVFGLVLLSAGLYALTEGVAFTDAIAAVLQRALLVPAVTSCMHFEVYPDIIPHVQWADFRPMRLLLGNDALQPQFGLISLDVAFAMSGQRWNANASMVATAWAEFGFLGVAINTVVMALGLGLIDYFVARKGAGCFMRPLVLYYWLGCLAYGNSPFLFAVMEQALWLIPFVFLLACHRHRSRRHSGSKQLHKKARGPVCRAGYSP